MAAPENKGNIITRRAFSPERGELELMAILRRVTNKAKSTAYQMVEEVGEYGSGLPSPLHTVCELIRERYEWEQDNGCEFSVAQEMAEYPLEYFRQLRGEARPGCDFVGRVNVMLKSASDANYLLKGRGPRELTPGELKEFSRLVMNVTAAARELGMAADEALRGAESEYPGAPIPGDRLRAAR